MAKAGMEEVAFLRRKQRLYQMLLILLPVSMLQKRCNASTEDVEA